MAEDVPRTVVPAPWPQTVYFDCFDGPAMFADLEGTSCADLVAVREAAGQSLIAIAQDNLELGEGLRGLRVLARDATGRHLVEASLQLHVATLS